MRKTLFVFLAILLSLKPFAQTSHKLGQIPPLSVGANRSLTITITDIPNKETLSIVPVREDLASKSITISNNQFLYNQLDNDYFAFKVGLKHGSKIDTIQIIPYYPQTPEYEFIQNNGNQPNSNSSYYIQINDLASKDEKLWNHQLVKIRRIEISGKNITVDLSNDNNVLKAIKQNPSDSICDKDIASISIYCDTLTLKTKLWLPQTEVKIYCKVLNFDKISTADPTFNNLGYINTTPINFPVGKKAEEYGVKGDNGINGGNILVNAQIIKNYVDEGILFVANGGNGQDGGPGRIGADSSNVPIGQNFSDKRGYFRDWPFCDQLKTIDKVIYGEYRNGKKIGSKTTTLLAGGNASFPGHGGLGGNGGEIFLAASNSDILSNTINSNPGAEGNLFGSKNTIPMVYRGGNGQTANWVTYDGPRTSFVIGDCSGIFGSCTEVNNTISYRVTPLEGRSGEAFPPALPFGFKSWMHFEFCFDSIQSIVRNNKIKMNSTQQINRGFIFKDINNDNLYDSIIVRKVEVSSNTYKYEVVGSFVFPASLDSFNKMNQDKVYYENIFVKKYIDSLSSHYSLPKKGEIDIKHDTSSKWLSPQYVEKEIQYIKDIYLSGNLEMTYNSLSQLKEYITIALRDTTNPFYLELSAKSVSMNSLLNRVASSLDYFGNPAGYCPLLSLWVNKKLFENSIDQSISNIILCRKILASQKNIYTQRANFDTLLSQLGNQLKAAYSNYDLYNVTLNQLLSDASIIANQIQALQIKIKLKEDDLLKIAQSEVEKAHEVPFLKKAAGILATVCKVIPVFQPVLGAIGQGLDFVGNINADDPLEIIQNVPDFYSVLNEKGFADSKKNFESKLLEIRLGDKNIMQYGKDLYKIYNNEYGSAIQKIIQAAKDSKVDAKEIYSKLEEIKASFPDYVELANELKELTDKKVYFNNRIADLTNKFYTTDALISEKLIQSAKLESAVRNLNTEGMPPETVSIISAIEKSEFERLLEYQYYLAKSYEYRMLEPYPNKLSFEHEFNSLIKIVDSTQSIPNETDRVAAIKLIYKNATQNVIDRFVYKLQNEKFVHQLQTLPYSLNDFQLSELNLKESTIIDLSNCSVCPFYNNQGNKIIYNIRLYQPTLNPVEKNGIVGTSLNIWGTEMYTSYNGHKFKFVMGKGQHPIYGVSVNTNPEFKEQKPPVEVKYDISELLEITNIDPKDLKGTKEYQSIFTRPSLETKIEIRDNSKIPVQYQSLKFEIEYGYISQSGFNYLQLICPDDQKPKIVVENMNTNIKSFFVDKFEYIFKDGNRIKITAEPFYGNKTFDHWEDHRGKTVSDESTYVLKRNDYTILKPIYK